MKHILRHIKIFTLLGVTFVFTSCYVEHVDPTPGPPGPPGDAFFGISYDDYPPYSYWDNNASIPYNPDMGVYYETSPGIYDFEYFINSREYWWGSYEIWINPGSLGRPYGRVGYRGADNYLMLICDYWGYHEHRDAFKKDDGFNITERPNGEIILTQSNGDKTIKVTMRKASIEERPAQGAKFLRSNTKL